MALPELAPRNTFVGVVVVWVAAAVIALVIGMVAPADWRAAWMPLGLGACFFLAFGIQLSYGTPQGFIQRVAASVLGAIAVMGFIGIGFGLATLFPA